MVAPKRRWTHAMGAAVRRINADNRRLRDAMLAILDQHEKLPVLYEDWGVCAVCDGAIEWPCATARVALEALGQLEADEEGEGGR